VLRGGLLGTLTTLLCAQGLPPLPGTPTVREVPDLSDLLPYRPMRVEAPGGETVPMRYRGERVVNGPEGWTIERGSIEGQDLLLLADHIVFNPATSMLVAEGNIRLESTNIRLRCERRAGPGRPGPWSWSFPRTGRCSRTTWPSPRSGSGISSR